MEKQFEDFKNYLDDFDEDIFEVLEDIGVQNNVIKFLKIKKRSLNFSDFSNFIKKISENLYFGCSLIEILEVTGEI